MPSTKHSTWVHTCDGCGTSTIAKNDEPLPIGFYVHVISIDTEMSNTGELYTCSENCLLRAFKSKMINWEAV